MNSELYAMMQNYGVSASPQRRNAPMAAPVYESLASLNPPSANKSESPAKGGDVGAAEISPNNSSREEDPQKLTVSRTKSNLQTSLPAYAPLPSSAPYLDPNTPQGPSQPQSLSSSSASTDDFGRAPGYTGYVAGLATAATTTTTTKTTTSTTTASKTVTATGAVIDYKDRESDDSGFDSDSSCDERELLRGQKRKAHPAWDDYKRTTLATGADKKRQRSLHRGMDTFHQRPKGKPKRNMEWDYAKGKWTSVVNILEAPIAHGWLPYEGEGEGAADGPAAASTVWYSNRKVPMPRGKNKFLHTWNYVEGRWEPYPFVLCDPARFGYDPNGRDVRQMKMKCFEAGIKEPYNPHVFYACPKSNKTVNVKKGKTWDYTRGVWMEADGSLSRMCSKAANSKSEGEKPPPSAGFASSLSTADPIKFLVAAPPSEKDLKRLSAQKEGLPSTWLIDFGSNYYVYRFKCPCEPKVTTPFYNKKAALAHVPHCKGVGDANEKPSCAGKRYKTKTQASRIKATVGIGSQPPPPREKAVMRKYKAEPKSKKAAAAKNAWSESEDEDSESEAPDYSHEGYEANVRQGKRAMEAGGNNETYDDDDDGDYDGGDYDDGDNDVDDDDDDDDEEEEEEKKVMARGAATKPAWADMPNITLGEILDESHVGNERELAYQSKR